MSSDNSERGTRFLQVIEAIGFPDIQNFSKTADIAHTTVRHQVGTGRFSSEVLYEISKRGGNVNWLLTGQGPMMIQEQEQGVATPEAEAQADNAQLLRANWDYMQAMIDRLNAENGRLAEDLRRERERTDALSKKLLEGAMREMDFKGRADPTLNDPGKGGAHPKK